MKAVQISKFGGVGALQVIADVSKPKPAPNQVLIRVHAASLNPADLTMLDGYPPSVSNLEFPLTIGGDFAGTVEETGKGIVDYNVGDEVYGFSMMLVGGSGSFAEYTVCNAMNMAKKPATLDFQHSAALPLAASTALEALEQNVHLARGQRVLIQGGSGGVGTFAIQIAKLHGAYVATTVAKKAFTYVKRLNADEVIDYQNENFLRRLKNIDVVLSGIGGEIDQKSLSVLKPKGTFIGLRGTPSNEIARSFGVKTIAQVTITDTLKLNRIAALVDSGKFKTHIAKTFTLDKIKQAFSYLKHDHPIGKVVIKVGHEQKRSSYSKRNGYT